MAVAPERIVWAPRAERDLIDIWHYLRDHGSEPVADAAVKGIYAAVERIRAQPLIGRPRNDVVQGLRSLLVAPHVVFYRVNDATVGIVRVLHERQSVERAFGKNA